MNWKNIKKMIADPKFKNKIIEYNVDDLKKKTAMNVKKRYINDINFNYDIVKAASTACAPLVLWVDSMIKYSAVKNSVVPLMKEMEKLEKAVKLLHDKMNELQAIQEQLAQKIEALKLEYA